MIEKYLTTRRIALHVLTSDWIGLVKKTGEIMTSLGDVTDDYTKAIINGILEHGPYVAVAPGVALLHARPEDGVKRQGLVIVTVEDGVAFYSPNDPVYVAIGLSAKDSDSHLELLQDLAVLLQYEGLMERVKQYIPGKELSLVRYLKKVLRLPK